MPSTGSGHTHHSFDPNATGASQPLPANEPGAPGREKHEREAALARGEAKAGAPASALCTPDVPGLRADLLFTLLAENVRDYAVFLMDANGIIRCWNEGARLMKWWTRQQAEGAHLRLLYKDGGSEDGTAEAHLQTAAQTGEYTGEGNRVRSDGSTLWAYTVLTALRDVEGRLVGFAKVTRDFTARRAVEAALTKQAQWHRNRSTSWKRSTSEDSRGEHQSRAPLATERDDGVRRPAGKRNRRA
jgi:PAS domain S-box-containing protein